MALCPRRHTLLRRLAGARPHTAALVAVPRRHFLFGIDPEKVKRSDAERAQRKDAKRQALRQELKSLPIRQLQVLMADTKPQSVHTPTKLLPANKADAVLPSLSSQSVSSLWPVVDATGTEHSLSSILTGNNTMTLLHISFNAHTFTLGQQWLSTALNQWPAIIASHPVLSSQSLQCYSLSLIKQQWVREWFGQYSLASLRKFASADRHAQTLSLLSSPHVTALESSPLLALQTQELLGYVLLIDERGRLRWQAWGQMETGENEILDAMIQQLAAEQAGVLLVAEKASAIAETADAPSTDSEPASSSPQPHQRQQQ